MEKLLNLKLCPTGNIRQICVRLPDGKFEEYDMNEHVVNAFLEENVWLVNSTPRMDGGRFGGRELGNIEYFHDMEGDGYGVMIDDANYEAVKLELINNVIELQVERVRKAKRELSSQRNLLNRLNSSKEGLPNAII